MENMLKKIKKFLASVHPTTILIMTITFLLVLGIYNRFIQDDAFISFRYAENFAQGYGLTWNIGDTEPIEGYTNFLWVLLMVPATYLGIDPVLWSMILGFIFGLGTLFFTYHVSLKITNSRFAALLSILLLGTNYTFSSYITGGLETQLQAFLIIFSVHVSLSLSRHKFNLKQDWVLNLGLSVLFSLAIMTRLDSVLICSVLFLATSYSVVTSQENPRKKTINLVFLIMPSVLIVGSWLLFKYFYYGDILPNTYYIKAAGNRSLKQGIFYTSVFFVSYGLFPFFTLGRFYFLKALKNYKSLIVLTSIIMIWTLYIIKVSGDFMEFRFFVPIMAPMYILISTMIFIIPSSKVKTISVSFLLCLSLFHAAFFPGTGGIDSISQLNYHVVGENENWQTIGRVLGDIFSAADPPVVISTTAAGAIPYYSKLPTIDMHGLSDKWIARNGIIIGDRPGHTHFTTIQYLIDSKVNLVLGHPIVREISSPATTNPNAFFLGILDVSTLPKTSQIIEIPLNSSYRIDVLYILKNSAVDKVIEDLKLVTHNMDVVN